MKRYLVFAGTALVIILLLYWVVQLYNRKETKSLSPEETVTFAQGELKIAVFYNRPYKKGRDIFGSLVPYDKVWRTGANEATTFETNQVLNFNGNVLPKGKYSLWTIPGEENWKIIFNSQHGQWGVNSKGTANRNPEFDALSFDVPAVQQERVFEQFTIQFEKVGEDAEMVLIWDQTLVAVPFSF